MVVIISMLRSVNLAGHNRLKMNELQSLYESLGLRDVQTYVQSGNVVFRTRAQNLARLGRQIEDAIEERFGFRSSVILRSRSELREVVARNPFAHRRGIEPNKLLVTFLAADPGAEPRRRLAELKIDPEELRADGRELYIYFPNGMGRPKLSWGTVQRILQTPWTGRNWNTVVRLLDMAETLEASARAAG